MAITLVPPALVPRNRLFTDGVGIYNLDTLPLRLLSDDCPKRHSLSAFRLPGYSGGRWNNQLLAPSHIRSAALAAGIDGDVAALVQQRDQRFRPETALGS